jgi:hypothetical protein
MPEKNRHFVKGYAIKAGQNKVLDSIETIGQRSFPDSSHQLNGPFIT